MVKFAGRLIVHTDSNRFVLGLRQVRLCCIRFVHNPTFDKMLFSIWLVSLVFRHPFYKLERDCQIPAWGAPDLAIRREHLGPWRKLRDTKICAITFL